jgi:hypothetical protein
MLLTVTTHIPKSTKPQLSMRRGRRGEEKRERNRERGSEEEKRKEKE